MKTCKDAMKKDDGMKKDTMSKAAGRMKKELVAIADRGRPGQRQRRACATRRATRHQFRDADA